MAFSGSPGAENKLRMPFQTLKHRFFDLTSHIGLVKRPKMSSKNMWHLDTSLF